MASRGSCDVMNDISINELSAFETEGPPIIVPTLNYMREVSNFKSRKNKQKIIIIIIISIKHVIF